jgi:hypothetical protein
MGDSENRQQGGGQFGHFRPRPGMAGGGQLGGLTPINGMGGHLSGPSPINGNPNLRPQFGPKMTGPMNPGAGQSPFAGMFGGAMQNGQIDPERRGFLSQLFAHNPNNYHSG